MITWAAQESRFGVTLKAVGSGNSSVQENGAMRERCFGKIFCCGRLTGGCEKSLASGRTVSASWQARVVAAIGEER